MDAGVPVRVVRVEGRNVVVREVEGDDERGAE